ncbi:MAG: TIM barrel protein [Planctomycetota bacterium]|jgi:hydroxypyruvate isomerase|nr:TIM barrel protein [Planctomycetota bacterium]
MKFSCCIEMIYAEAPFMRRFPQAKADGFEYVEFWNWDGKDIPAIKQALKDNGLKLAAFQGDCGGRMVDGAEHERYLDGVRKGIEIARELGAMNMFLMSDILQEDRTVKPMANPIGDEEKRANSLAMLKRIAPLVEKAGVVGVIEPLNTTVDHAGYSLRNTAPAVEMLKEVGSPNLRLLYDAYHMQIMEGNIIANIRDFHEYFGHFHVADVPGRHEPGTGELNYHNILKALGETGYGRLVGFELEPRLASSGETMRRLLAEYGEL